MKKASKHIIKIIIAGVILYNSIYFQSLDQKLAEGKEIAFDASLFVEGIWENELLSSYGSATDLHILIDQLNRNPQGAFKTEGRSLGIGNIGYFRVQGAGTVQSVHENNILVQVGNQSIEIELEFIFGNAVRDASGILQLNDYDKTSDFNDISEAINAKIRKEVVPAFREQVAVGDKIQFKGALQLNKAHLDINQPEIIPVFLNIIP